MRRKLLFVLLFTISAYSQQDSQFTQYMYNTINVNPAYAGSRGVASVFLLHRTQWVGLDGAPVTNTASFHMPIQDSKWGIGVSVINDRIGISDENAISADFSYTLQLVSNFRLSFGLKSTANLFSVDFSRLTLRDPGDYAISQQQNINNQFRPNIGAGIYVHSDKTYLGLSIPALLETKRYDDNISSVANEKMHLFFIAGTVFDLKDNIQFKPALLTKLVNGAPLQVDLSGNFLINRQFTIGVAYRWDAAFTAMAGFQISNPWYIGYSYDMEATQLANYNSGTHELFLRYELFSNYDRIVSPRFF